MSGWRGAQIRNRPAQTVEPQVQIIQIGEGAQIRDLPAQTVVSEVQFSQVGEGAQVRDWSR